MRKFLVFLVGIIIGSVLGSAAAMLLAPSSGIELRKQIQQKTQYFFAEIEDAGKQKRDELELELQQLRTPENLKAKP